MMTIHEFGEQNKKTILFLQPSAVMWDYFEYVIPLLKNDYHLIIPALPGYDKEKADEDFTSVEDIASDLIDGLAEKKLDVDLLYGCSMGGAIVLRMLAMDDGRIKSAVVDGGITPYQLPWIITRLIAIRDFLMISMGKIGGLKLLEEAFSTDEYSEEDLRYLADVLKFMSFKTIWRTFDSCNNYAMPQGVIPYPGRLQYWYGDKEEKDRAWDISYIKKHFPSAELIELNDTGHGGMASLHPGEMAKRLSAIITDEIKE